jgi:hypothetical protein
MPFRRIVCHFVAIFQFGHQPVMLDRTTMLRLSLEFRAHILPPHAMSSEALLGTII